MRMTDRPHENTQGVRRPYFSQKIVPNTNFLEIAPQIRLYGNGEPLFYALQC